MNSRRVTALIILIIALITIPLLYIALQQYNIFAPKASSLDPQRITVSNLTETSASLTWATPGGLTIGSIVWGNTTDLGSTQTDLRDKRDNTTQARKSHAVTLTSLQPNTTYYYRVLVGTTTYPAASAAPASFNTLPTSTAAQPTTLSAYGDIAGANLDMVITAYVKGTDGYTDSIPLSAIPNTDGTWYVNIAAARTKVTGAYIVPTATTAIVLIADGGSSGSVVTKVASDSPFQLSLANDFSETLINTTLGITSTTTSETPTITPTETTTATSTPTPTTTGTQDVPILPIGSSPTPTQPPSTTLTSDDIYNSFVSPSISNVSDSSASIMWLSSDEEAEVLAYGTATNALTLTKRDDRDASAATPHRLHHITVTDLSQNTPYYFKTTTDSTARTFSTPLAITSPSETALVKGTFTNATGECLVRTQIKRGSTLSAVITTLPNPAFGWSLNIAPVRNAALTAYFTPSANDVVVTNAFCIATNGDVWYATKATTVSDATSGTMNLVLTKLP